MEEPAERADTRSVIASPRRPKGRRGIGSSSHFENPSNGEHLGVRSSPPRTRGYKEL